MTATTATPDTTTEQVPEAADRPAPAPRRRLRPLRKLLLTALTLVTVATGASLATASPASAATGVTYCFVQTNGRPLPLEGTQLAVWNGSGWQWVADGRTGTNGCGSFNTNAWRNSYVKVFAGTYMNNRLVGTTPYWATPGAGSVHLGTGVAWLSW